MFQLKANKPYYKEVKKSVYKLWRKWARSVKQYEMNSLKSKHFQFFHCVKKSIIDHCCIFYLQDRYIKRYWIYALMIVLLLLLFVFVSYWRNYTNDAKWNFWWKPRPIIELLGRSSKLRGRKDPAELLPYKSNGGARQKISRTPSKGTRI